MASDDHVWPTTPHETGSWSTRQGTWIPHQRGIEQPDFAIGRFEDSGDISAGRPGVGRILDHDDWYEVPSGQPAGWTPTRPADPSVAQPRDWSERGTTPQRHNTPDWSSLGESARSQQWSVEPQPQPSRGTDSAHRSTAPPWSTKDSRADIARPAYVQFDERGSEPSETEEEGGSYLSAVVATLAWYAIPAVLYTVWTLLIDGSARPGCLTELGAPCPSPRSQALHAIVGSLPWLAVALLLSILVALLIRWASTGWRAITVGFSAAVVGAGVVTVLHTVFTGSG